MSPEELLNYNIPYATPFVYEFDRHLNPLRYYYLLGEDLTEEDVLLKEKFVASQGTTSFEDLDQQQLDFSRILDKKD
jgi:hypothetical protein